MRIYWVQVVINALDSKFGPWTSSIDITWELVRDADPGLHLRPAE